MRHFGIGHWTDYVRGLGEKKDRRAMRRHLEEGCSSCARIERTLAGVAETVDRDPLTSSPGIAGRPVREVLATRPGGRWKRADAEFLDLVWDSARAPLPRAQPETIGDRRRLHYASDDYDLEVSISDVGGREVVIEGRLTSRHREPVARLATFLVQGREVVATTATAASGDFRLSSEPEDWSEIWIRLSGRRTVAAPLQPV